MATEEKKNEMLERAYVTLLSSNDFIPGLVAMLFSYNMVRNPNIPMIVMVTPDITEINRNIISKAYGAIVLEVEPITLPDSTNTKRYLIPHQRKSVHTAMTKFRLFTLDGVKKVVFVDGDMVFLQNTDELFDCPPFSFVEDTSSSRNSFNSGLYVAEPNMDTFNTFIKILYDNYYEKDYDVIDDQSVLDIYLPDWAKQEELHLSMIYNYQIYECLYTHGPEMLLALPSKVKILHMMGLSKPWITPFYQYFLYNGGYTTTAFMEYYVELINGCIYRLAEAGYTSPNLELIHLSNDFPDVAGARYPKSFSAFNIDKFKKEE